MGKDNPRRTHTETTHIQMLTLPCCCCCCCCSGQVGARGQARDWTSGGVRPLAGVHRHLRGHDRAVGGGFAHRGRLLVLRRHLRHHLQVVYHTHNIVGVGCVRSRLCNGGWGELEEQVGYLGCSRRFEKKKGPSVFPSQNIWNISKFRIRLPRTASSNSFGSHVVWAVPTEFKPQNQVDTYFFASP